MKQQVNKTILSFFGPPGSGKGTLAERLEKEHGFKVLSTGNLCRGHIAAQSEIGKSLSKYLDRGTLIPDSLMVDMVIDWLEKSIQEGHPIILDGFPRTRDQVIMFNDYLKKSLPDYCFRVILIYLPDEEIVKRISSRLVCENKSCQAVYSQDQDVKLCSKCHGNLIKRNDDREEVVRQRLSFYPEYRDDLLSYYKSSGQVVERLDVFGLSKDQVYSTFLASL